MGESSVAGMEDMQNKEGKLPTCIIVLGMAGSGKTTWVQRVTAHLHAKKKPPYVVNLDPACIEVPYPANIDIRDTVNYKEVMKQYKLGPNGAIVTSLNLFSTRFDQVISLLQKRSSDYEYVIFDTPGQIEVFTWSASGDIITKTLASVFPTVVVYIMDTVRSVSPVTFMSNMLYACSILYKSRLPFVITMNKIDVVSHQYAVEWMTDSEAFEESLRSQTSYISTLAGSLSVVLDEFYQNLNHVGVSAVTGKGIEEFFSAIEKCREEYEEDYKPELQRRLAEEGKKIKEEKANALKKIQKEGGQGDAVQFIPPSRSIGDEVLIRPSEEASDEEPDSEEEGKRPSEDEEEDPEEKKEYESFKAFLEREKAKKQTASSGRGGGN